MFHFHKCFAVKAETFSDELCASEIYQGFQSIANTYDWFPFASSFPSETVTSLQLQSFVFVPSYFQSILFSTSISVDFQSTVSFKQNDKKTCFDCVILLVFFFSLLFSPTWHKNLFTFHFSMYTPPSTHSIGSILFEKKENKSTAYQWLKRKRLGTHSGFLIDAFTPFDLWKRA